MSTVPLLDLVDFKWLMAGEGQRVHLERLQSDSHYADDCLQRAALSKNEALRRCAERLRRLMR